jgi:hypothetical protein
MASSAVQPPIHLACALRPDSLRITIVVPFVTINILSLKSDIVRVTVSRERPTSDTYNQSLAVGGSHHQLHLALAKHIDPAWILPLDKQHGFLRIRGSKLHVAERLERGKGQLAKKNAVLPMSVFAKNSLGSKA